jgi:diguanylate cyclase (GGDEF)-like protein
VWVLAWELAITAAILVCAWSATPANGHQWWTGAALLVAATIHHYATRPGEERRFAINATSPIGEHIEPTVLWLAPAAVLLTVPQMVLLLVIVRFQRWTIARKNMTQWGFASAAIAGSMVAAHLVTAAILGHLWRTTVSPLSQVTLPLALGVGSVAYFLVQALLVPGVRALDTTTRLTSAELISLLGSRQENTQEACALAMAAVFTGMAAWSPLGLVEFALPVAVAATVLIEREAATRGQAVNDPKTGLPNARGWKPQARRAIEQSSQDRPTAVLMIDLDRLKQLNTTLGHVGADIVIDATASVLRSSTRPGDVLGRWGGDEFVALLPATDLIEAVQIADRIRSGVEALRLPVTAPAGGETWIIGLDIPAATVTIGVAVAPTHGNTLDEVIDRADRVLLAGKDTTRNAVYSAL